MKEVFKSVNGYPEYEVSNFGRVKTKSRLIRYTHAVTRQEHFRQTEERFLKVQFNNRTGYKFVQLYKNKKMHNVTTHKAVADTFLVKGKKDFVVNHKDGNKHNNTVDNLEFVSNEYNHEHAKKTGLLARGERIGSSKLNKHCVFAIRGLLKLGWSHGDIAKLFKISRPNVSMIKEGKTWNALTGTELFFTPSTKQV